MIQIRLYLSTNPVRSVSTYSLNQGPKTMELQVLLDHQLSSCLLKSIVFIDIQDDAVNIKIAAPPIDGEANKELVRYIARLLKLRTSDVNLDRVFD